MHAEDAHAAQGTLEGGIHIFNGWGGGFESWHHKYTRLDSSAILYLPLFRERRKKWM